MSLWPLLGIVVLVAGFAAGINPLIVIVAAALTTGVAAGLSPLHIIAALGKAYNDSRYVSIIWLVLPVIGLLEREGLQERARMLIARVRAATVGRLLIAYLVLRQVTAALGLTSLCGQAQTVRPLIAPMAEAAAEIRMGSISSRIRYLIRAYAASADNVGAFFGEDIFIAVSSILLIKGFLQQSGYDIAPLRLSLWAIPTALMAFAIHGLRLWRLDARLKRLAREERS
ncbi:MAG: DUF969 domain-containing protein [Gammaproteobacteria bacterium]|nr:DUF969 domain-containing protein [Gammaproteobacteria bacterium]MDE2260952.1 DUF969 domain-containing protein [Gammaproteobacteria bacterium]